MAYINSLHTTVSKPIGINNTPTDARSYFYDGALFVYRCYVSTTEVLNYLATSANRIGQFSIYINSTGTLNLNGSITGGTVLEYWFKDGTLNSNLVVKSANITLTTTGNNGVSTLVSGVLNIPTYTIGGLGGIPYIGATSPLVLGNNGLSSTDGSNIVSILPNGNITSNDSTNFVNISPGVLAVTGASGIKTQLLNASLIFTQSNTFTGTLSSVTLTGNRTWQFPNYSGTFAMINDVTSLSTVYQPIEDQRLSTTNSPVFAGITLSGTNSLIVNKTTLTSDAPIIATQVGIPDFTVIDVLQVGIKNADANTVNWKFRGISVAFGNPSYDVIIYLPQYIGGTMALTSDISTYAQPLENQRLSTTNSPTFNGLTLNSTVNGTYFVGFDFNANTFSINSSGSFKSILGASLTANRNLVAPDNSGIIALTSDISALSTVYQPLFSGTTSQYVRGNGSLATFPIYSNTTPSTISGSTSGSAICNQPYIDTYSKRVIIYLNALVGNITYTYPTAFTNAPTLISGSTSMQYTLSDITTTSVKVSSIGGTPSIGFVVLEGY